MLIYDTLTRQKKPLELIEPGKLSMYVCGITVYDDCHIGHAKSLISFDVIYRYFKFKGLDVRYVRNITDIDDKIIARAVDNKESTESLTSRFIDRMNQDLASLNVLRPTDEPKATDYMQHMVDMILTLIDKGHAYQGEKTGDVFFRVNSHENYGCLSGKNTCQLESGQRVEVNSDKESPLDFVLWKMSKPDEPSWNSPWGYGRPGWHIECSAMASSLLGDEFDIHGGGMDLQFPHHENEIAQSQCTSTKSYAKQWLHNGFVTIDNEKMSKSLGNFFTIRDVLEKFSGEVIRFFVVSSHYRSQLNYSDVQLQQAKDTLSGFYRALEGIQPNFDKDDEFTIQKVKAFTASMDDDFNTPKAVSVLHEIASLMNIDKNKNDVQAAEIKAGVLVHLAGIIGLLQGKPQDFFQGSVSDSIASKVEKLIVERKQARSEKNWAQADRVRDELNGLGVVLEDKEGVTTWRLK